LYFRRSDDIVWKQRHLPARLHHLILDLRKISYRSLFDSYLFNFIAPLSNAKQLVEMGLIVDHLRVGLRSKIEVRTIPAVASRYGFHWTRHIALCA